MDCCWCWWCGASLGRLALASLGMALCLLSATKFVGFGTSLSWCSGQALWGRYPLPQGRPALVRLSRQSASCQVSLPARACLPECIAQLCLSDCGRLPHPALPLTLCRQFPQAATASAEKQAAAPPTAQAPTTQAPTAQTASASACEK